MDAQMRNHARILTAIWQNADFIALSLDAQWLYIAVLSQPNLSLVGVIDYTPRRWVGYCPQLNEKRLARSLQELVDAKFVAVDENTQEIAVRSFLRHDAVLGNPNMLKAAVVDLRSVLSPTLREIVRDAIPDAHRTAFETALGTASRTPSETASRMPPERRTSITPPPAVTPPPPRDAVRLPSGREPPPGGEEEEDQNRSRIAKAVGILAQRDMDGATTRGVAIRDRSAWLSTAAARRAAQDGPRLAEVHAAHPGWTAQRLADAVIGSTAPVIAEYEPAGVGNGAPMPDELRRRAKRVNDVEARAEEASE